MKKPKNSSTRKFWKKEKKEQKLPPELNVNWCDEAVQELIESIEKDKKVSNDLKNQLWEELNRSSSLNKLRGKMNSGEMPNDLECLLIDYIRV